MQQAKVLSISMQIVWPTNFSIKKFSQIFETEVGIIILNLLKAHTNIYFYFAFFLTDLNYLIKRNRIIKFFNFSNCKLLKYLKKKDNNYAANYKSISLF